MRVWTLIAALIRFSASKDSPGSGQDGPVSGLPTTDMVEASGRRRTSGRPRRSDLLPWFGRRPGHHTGNRFRNASLWSARALEAHAPRACLGGIIIRAQSVERLSRGRSRASPCPGRGRNNAAMSRFSLHSGGPGRRLKGMVEVRENPLRSSRQPLGRSGQAI